MANGWAPWKKLRCVVEVKVPPNSAITTKHLIHQVELALEDKNILLTSRRDWHPNMPTPKIRVMNFGKVIQADKAKSMRESKSD